MASIPQVQTVPKGPGTIPRRWHWIVRVLLPGCGFLLLVYIFRIPLLIGMAKAWVVNDPVTRADAIVVLGGGLENRPFAAAKLFHEGVASRIVYMDVRLSPAAELHVAQPEREQTRQILSSNGVPETAMTAVGNSVGNTYDESRAVRGWAETSGVRSIVIPTDPFHTRRVRWIFRRAFHDKGTAIHVVAVNPVRYRLEDWWQDEDGWVAFHSELLKYVYYRCNY
jgi:uncharacterized SAM-binding protein YcdF (DUF218 family)